MCLSHNFCVKFWVWLVLVNFWALTLFELLFLRFLSCTLWWVLRIDVNFYKMRWLIVFIRFERNWRNIVFCMLFNLRKIVKREFLSWVKMCLDLVKWSLLFMLYWNLRELGISRLTFICMKFDWTSMSVTMFICCLSIGICYSCLTSFYLWFYGLFYI